MSSIFPTSFADMNEYRTFFKPLIQEECDHQRKVEEWTISPNSIRWVSKLHSGEAKKFDLIGLVDCPLDNRGGHKLRIGGKIQVTHPLLCPKLGKITAFITFMCPGDVFEISISHDVIDVAYGALSSLEKKDFVLMGIFDSTSFDRMSDALGKSLASPALELSFLGIERTLTHQEQQESQFLDPKYIPSLEQIKFQGHHPLTDTQAQAVHLALINPIMSIQGPPGTGKSSTLSVLASTLSKCIKLEYEQKLQDFEKHLDTIDGADLDAFINHITSPPIPPPPKPKPLLVCAPSNTATDHLASVLINSGLDVLRISSYHYRKKRFQSDDKVDNCSLHRRVQAWLLLNPESELATLQHEIFDGLGEDDKETFFSRLTTIFNNESNHIDGEINESAFQQEFKAQFKGKSILASKSKFDKSKGPNKPNQKSNNSKNDFVRWAKLYHELQRDIIASVDVVCSTFLGTGNRVLFYKFDHIILDEVSQSTEPELLIPLMHKSKHIVLFGDHKQLGPIILSPKAKANGLERSLFLRLMESQTQPKIMLDTQFRMHPAIAKFSSKEFYGGKLKNGVLAENRNHFQHSFPWPNPQAPICLIDVKQGKQDFSGTSRYNEPEIEVLESIIFSLVSNRTNLSDIGVAIPYEAQMDKLKECLYNPRGRLAKLVLRLESNSFEYKPTIQDAVWLITERLEIRSIESYQGSEKPMIIFNTVSTGVRNSNFISDPLRLNVGLTRAQHGLIIVGHRKTLSQIKYWTPLVKIIEGYKNVIDSNDFINKVPIFIEHYAKQCLQLRITSKNFVPTPKLVVPKPPAVEQDNITSSPNLL